MAAVELLRRRVSDQSIIFQIATHNLIQAGRLYLRMKTLIKNARVVLPTGTIETAVLVDGAKIAAIDAAVQTRADETIDARGLYLIPGVIDDQVHFREPGLTHKEDLWHASHACAAGGVTTFLEMPNTLPNATTQERINEKLALAAEKSLVNYGFYIGATPRNIADLNSAQRTPGIKIFIGSSTGELLVDDQDALERIFAETTLPICAHCEDEKTLAANKARIGETRDVADHSRIRDVKAAVVATIRAVELAVRHQHRFHVLHVSTAAELNALPSREFVRAREELGMPAWPAHSTETLDPDAPLELVRKYLRAVEKCQYVTAEVCPHHLFFNTQDYARFGTFVQMNPSLKSQDDNQGLWQALLDGRIQVVATDHAPHTLEEKAKPYPQSPSGLPAVENSLALMLNQVDHGNCTIEQVVHWMCDAPARVWDIVDKGRIAVGYDADLVLVDLDFKKTIRNAEQYTKCKWSPWDGVELTGWPVRTWVLGQEVFRRDADGAAVTEKFNESIRGREAVYDHARGGYWAIA
jgi:dihydroorotase